MYIILLLIHSCLGDLPGIGEPPGPCAPTEECWDLATALDEEAVPQDR